MSKYKTCGQCKRWHRYSPRTAWPSGLIDNDITEFGRCNAEPDPCPAWLESVDPAAPGYIHQSSEWGDACKCFEGGSAMSERNWQADWELCQEATEGPWILTHDAMTGTDGRMVRKSPESAPIAHVMHGSDNQKADGEFITEAREALPYWLKRARELEVATREAILRMEEAVKQIEMIPVEERPIRAVWAQVSIARAVARATYGSMMGRGM